MAASLYLSALLVIARLCHVLASKVLLHATEPHIVLDAAMKSVSMTKALQLALKRTNVVPGMKSEVTRASSANAVCYQRTTLQLLFPMNNKTACGSSTAGGYFAMGFCVTGAYPSVTYISTGEYYFSKSYACTTGSRFSASSVVYSPSSSSFYLSETDCNTSPIYYYSAPSPTSCPTVLVATMIAPYGPWNIKWCSIKISTSGAGGYFQCAYFDSSRNIASRFGTFSLGDSLTCQRGGYVSSAAILVAGTVANVYVTYCSA